MKPKQLQIGMLYAGILLLTNGCGSESTGNTVAEDITPVDVTDSMDITNIELTNRSGSCANYVGSYESTVTDIKRGIGFMGDFTISLSGSNCTFSSNDIPNHDFNDSSAAFATNVAEVAKTYTLPAEPSIAASITELALGTTNGIFLNGVVLDILPAACYGVGSEPLGQEKIGCGNDQIHNPWRYDPMSTLNGFGTDIHNAHVQPDGTYHYHGNPVALFAQDCDTQAEASPVIGFAADGFPIFGSCIEDNGTIRPALTSFQLKSGTRQAVTGYSTPTANTGSIASNNYDGQFRGDYQYVENSGDLDECNGMTVDGQYGYYVTASFPWVTNCFKGEVQSSFNARNLSEFNNKLHGHSH